MEAFGKLHNSTALSQEKNPISIEVDPRAGLDVSLPGIESLIIRHVA
jgi:hypothetical protein